jgi:hypothetical protein
VSLDSGGASDDSITCITMYVPTMANHLHVSTTTIVTKHNDHRNEAQHVQRRR